MKQIRIIIKGNDKLSVVQKALLYGDKNPSIRFKWYNPIHLFWFISTPFITRYRMKDLYKKYNGEK